MYDAFLDVFAGVLRICLVGGGMNWGLGMFFGVLQVMFSCVALSHGFCVGLI